MDGDDGRAPAGAFLALEPDLRPDAGDLPHRVGHGFDLVRGQVDDLRQVEWRADGQAHDRAGAEHVDARALDRGLPSNTSRPRVQVELSISGHQLWRRITPVPFLRSRTGLPNASGDLVVPRRRRVAGDQAAQHGLLPLGVDPVRVGDLDDRVAVGGRRRRAVDDQPAAGRRHADLAARDEAGEQEVERGVVVGLGEVAERVGHALGLVAVDQEVGRVHDVVFDARADRQGAAQVVEAREGLAVVLAATERRGELGLRQDEELAVWSVGEDAQHEQLVGVADHVLDDGGERGEVGC